WGAYSRAGDSLRFEAHLTNATSEEALESTTAGGAVQQPTQGVELLRQRVMTALAARLDPHFAKFEGASRPVSYDAYKEFLVAEGKLDEPCPPWRDCDAGDAAMIAHYRRAYALDSNFTLALVAIARESFFMGQCARTDSIANVLRPRRDQLPSFDRAQLDEGVASCHGNRPAALAAVRQQIAAAPKSDQSALKLAWYLRHSGFFCNDTATTEKLDRTRNEH